MDHDNPIESSSHGDGEVETQPSKADARPSKLLNTSGSAGPKQDEENKFQRAISAWRNIDLGTVIPTYDTTAVDIVSHQRESLVQRKDLAQKTKEFRKLDDTDKLAEIKGLLKAYQTFIDSLSNHAKSTSSAFLQIYSSLAEAPDPYPLLEASVESLVLSEDTLPRIKDENLRLQGSISKLTSQLDETEQRLDGERVAKKSLEEAQEKKAKEVEASWAAVMEEKEDNWAAKERSLEEKVENQDRLLKELKASYEVSQRLGSAEGGGEDGVRAVASAAELEMMASDLERTSLRLAEVESRNEQLRLELAHTASHSQSAPSSYSAEEDPDFLRLRSENASLLRKIEAARIEKESEARNLEGKVRTLEREIAQVKVDRENARSKLQKWNDYDEVKRELEMLKSIEFATGDEDDLVPKDETDVPSSNIPRGENGAASTGKGDTLEKLLLARNKKLADELTILRVSHRDLQTRLEAMQHDLSEAITAQEKFRQLAATLEDDLVKVQQEASNVFPSNASVAGTYVSRHPQSYASPAAHSVAGRRGRASPTSSIISGIETSNGYSGTLDAIRAGEAVGGGSGILPMVTAQRDRFKQRNAQLEDELSKAYTSVSSLRQEVAALQKDNLDLYEKTRYVSSYHRGPTGTSSSSSAYALNHNPATVQMSSSQSASPSLDRYRSAYEANISPFAAFRGRESARAFKRMSLPERVVFSITRMVLANRTSRNMFAAYCFALHVLVLVLLYWMGTSDLERHASNLGDVATAAAAAAAAGPVGAASGSEAHHGDWHQEGFSGGG